MIQVRCDGCQATFELDERRIPKSGMRVRCPKCGSSFHVTPEGITSALQPPGAKPAAPPPPKAPLPPSLDSLDDLPATAGPNVGLPAPVAPRIADLPAKAAPKLSDLPSRVAPKPSDLPSPAAPRIADLPARVGSKGGDLPVAAAPKLSDLPALASPSVHDLPAVVPTRSAPQSADLPALRGAPPRAPGIPQSLPTAPGIAAHGDLPATAKPRVPAPPPRMPRDMDFGDIGEMDLPAALGSADLPVPARRVDLPSPVRPPAAAPASSGNSALVDLNNLDDLPMAAGAGLPAVMGTNDLDDPFASRPAMTVPGDLPVRKLADVPATKAGVVDLPTAKAGVVDLPTTKAGVVDLPTKAGVVDLPALPGSDLPATVSPDAAAAGKRLGRVTLERRAVPMDEAGLPATARNIGLPTVSAALPAPAAVTALPSVQTSLPARRAAEPSGFGELDLDMQPPSIPPPPGGGATGSAALKAPPMPSEFDGLAMRPPSLAPPSGGADFDLGSAPGLASIPPLSPTGFHPHDDLPMPPPPSSPPAAFPSGPVRKGAPAAAPGPSPQRPTGNAGGTGFGEISLGGDEEQPAHGRTSVPPDGDEFDQIPLEDAPRKSADSGAAPASREIETAIPPRELVGDKFEQPADKSRTRTATDTTGKTSGHPRLYAALGLAGVIVIGGAALSLTPYGAYGTTWLDERLHGEQRHAAARRAIESVRVALDRDTYAGARTALRALDTQIQRTPSEHGLFAYGAYASYVFLARFGNDGPISSRARALFDRLPTLPPGTANVSQARLAHDLSQNHLDAVRRASVTDPMTRDLRTMALLDGDDPAAALDAAHAAFERAHTTRSHFLYARALFIADDRAGAIRESEAILHDEPQHAGARLLLARLLRDRSETRDRAVSLAGEVDTMGNGASTDEHTEAAVLIGETELARDHITAARQAFEHALELDPRSSTALNGVATILYRQSNYTESLARFQAAHTADPDDLDAVIGMAMAFIALNQPADARAALEPLVPTHPNEPNLHFWLARALLAANEGTAAEREFREAIRLDNANLEAYTTLASMLFATQRPEAAEAVLQEARAHVSDQASIHRALGEGRAARGDLVGAIGELEQAVAARHDDVRSHFIYAQTLRRLQRYDEAARQLSEVERIDADYPGVLLERGQLLEARGDAAGALTTFRAALSRDPGNPELIVRVVSALIATGQYAEAEGQVGQLLAEHGTIAEAHYLRGRAMLGLGNAEQAVQAFNRAIELDATRADFRAYAAEANLALAQYGAALDQANRAISIDANYPRGYWVRGEVRVRSGAAAQGLMDVQQALRLDPRFAPALATLAEADDALGHSPEAIIVYRQAIAIEPNRGEWHSRLGRLLADSGHTADAIAELNRSVSLGDPMNPPPAWLAPAHRQLGDLTVDSDRAGARRHFQRFLDLTPPSAAGYADVRRTLTELGGR